MDAAKGDEPGEGGMMLRVLRWLHCRWGGDYFGLLEKRQPGGAGPGPLDNSRSLAGIPPGPPKTAKVPTPIPICAPSQARCA